MVTARELEDALLTLNRTEVERSIRAGIEELGPLQAAEDLIAPALESIGESWHDGRIALSQVYMSGKMCDELLGQLLPGRSVLREGSPRIAVAALEDYHLLGCKIIVSVLRASGFDVLDYGRASVDGLVDKVAKDKVQLLMVSSLMMRSALRVKDLVAGIKASSATTVVVGGAPFNFDPELWRRVNADLMGRSAGEALKIAAEAGA